ncbi:MAG: hypothetical protein H0S85_12570 [Desulfovibrionaceae bacterium]|jgi:hypothetical protein|nr:hypothetical protein [Desulfovibrionaceae bacterium]
MHNHIVRGILIGGSLGVFAALLLDMHMGRAIAWGMVAGFLAGLTMERRRDRGGR